MKSTINHHGNRRVCYWQKPLQAASRLSFLALLLLASSCAGPSGQRTAARQESLPLVPFSGSRNSPPGNGVDLSLHNKRVNENPNSNPRLAWNDRTCLTIMAHGKRDSPRGPVLIDERNGPDKLITPSELALELKRDVGSRQQLASSECVVLYACHSGRATSSEFPSFAQRLANLLKKPVIAPSGILYMHSGRGVVKGKGRFLKFEPSGLFLH